MSLKIKFIAAACTVAAVVSSVRALGFLEQGKFRFSAGAETDDGDYGEEPLTAAELNKELQKIEKYKCRGGKFVDLYEERTGPDYAGSPGDLLKALNGTEQELWPDPLPDIYADKFITVAAQEPRYTKMLFSVFVHTYNSLDSVELLFRYNDRKKTQNRVKIHYVAPSLTYRGTAEMPEGATKVKIVDIKLVPGRFRLSARYEFNRDLAKFVERKGNNTIVYNTRKKTVILVVDSSMCATDCISMEGSGSAVTSYGAEYFFIIE